MVEHLKAVAQRERRVRRMRGEELIIEPAAVAQRCPSGSKASPGISTSAVSSSASGPSAIGSGMLYAPGATAFKSSSHRNFIVSPYTFGTATRLPSQLCLPEHRHGAHLLIVWQIPVDAFRLLIERVRAEQRCKLSLQASICAFVMARFWARMTARSPFIHGFPPA